MARSSPPRTLEIAAALNLEPCFTPVESPESNGMAEAFLKTFRRDYVRINPIPDARTALLRIDQWMEDYNSEHPHSRLGYRSPREYIASLKQLSVRSNGGQIHVVRNDPTMQACQINIVAQ